MKWIAAYAGALVSFGALEVLWIRWAGPNLYRPALGELMADNARGAPAIAFFLIYAAGMVWFAVRPGWSGGLSQAAINGALLGAVCYATYDLTNQTTLKVWPTYITVTDIAWGAFATSVAATAATFLVQKLG